MSEKLYALFLRLYPARFREEYGDEALQLFRDRARDERGFFRRVRLWFDLLFDLTVSLPREYFDFLAPRAIPSVPKRLTGIPTFYVLQNEPVRPAALLSGSVLSFLALTTCWISFNSAINPYHSAAQSQNAFGSSDSARSSSEYPNSNDSAASPEHYAPNNVQLDLAERKRILAAAVANLKNHYHDHAAAQKMVDSLMAHENHGDYNAVPD